MTALVIALLIIAALGGYGIGLHAGYRTGTRRAFDYINERFFVMKRRN